MSSQSPGAEGYGEAANSMVRKAEATHPARARKQVLDEKNKESWPSGFDFCASNFTQAD